MFDRDLSGTIDIQDVHARLTYLPTLWQRARSFVRTAASRATPPLIYAKRDAATAVSHATSETVGS